MKKILAILVAVCLMSVSCISAFAANDFDFGIPSFGSDAETTEEATTSDRELTLFEQAMNLIENIEADGAVTDEEILAAADEMYNDTTISKEVYDEVYRIIENGLHSHGESSTAEQNESIINEITAIVNDDSLSIGDKVTKIVDLLRGLPSDRIETILNDLRAAGVIDDNVYNMISDMLNGDNTDVTNPSPVSGIQDFISNILEMLGIGGGDDEVVTDVTPDDADTNNGSDSSDSSNSSSSADSGNFEGSNAKTGDYAIASVAGIAAVAGLALVLTKIKKNDNND